MENAILAQRMLTLVLDALPVRVFWKDIDSRLLGCNQGFAEDAGVSRPEELIGKTFFEFYPLNQARAYRADDLEVMTSGRAKLGIEEQLLLHSGRTTQVETNKIPLRDEDGAVIGVLATYTDISQRLAVAEEAERRADALKIARDVALTSAAAKARFVENISRELRVPLESIIAESEQILLAPGESNAREATAIMDAARHLLDLARQMSDVSKFAVEEPDAADEWRQVTAAR